MNLLKIAAASSVILAGVLAGCASDPLDMNTSSYQTGMAPYSASQASYMTNTSIGSVMTTPQGATVYTFDKDINGKSTCYGECAKHWPPVVADTSAVPFGQMTLVTRTDGRRQWAHDGKLLYTYHGDTIDGDVAGDNEGGVWHVVR